MCEEAKKKIKEIMDEVKEKVEDIYNEPRIKALVESLKNVKNRKTS